MDFDNVKAWLTEWSQRQAAARRAKATVAFCLCPVALLAAFALVFGLMKFFSRTPDGEFGDTYKCLWIAIAVIPVMFVINRFAPRRDLMEERMSAGAGESFRGPGARGEVWLTILIWIICAGPRLLDWGFALMREAKGMLHMDVHGCAAVLWMILSAGKKVPYEDMLREMDWLDLDRVRAELAFMPGVLFLQGPPPAMTLVTEKRSEIIAEIKART